jgi:hypothetical protein
MYLPRNFRIRRSNVISDRDIMLTKTGMLCNASTDFTNASLYAENTIFRRFLWRSRLAFVSDAAATSGRVARRAQSVGAADAEPNHF